MQLGGEAQISTAESGGMRVMVTFRCRRIKNGDCLVSWARRSTGVIVGLTIAVLIGTAALLAIHAFESAARQQRLVVASYETLALMRQAVIAPCRTPKSASVPIC